MAYLSLREIPSARSIFALMRERRAAFYKLPHGDERDAFFIENFKSHKDCIRFDRQRESWGNGSHGPERTIRRPLAH